MQVVGRVLNVAFGVVVAVLLSRELGTAGFGQWSTLLAVVALAGPIADFGFAQVAVREGAARPQDAPQVIGGLLAARTALAVVTTALAMLAVALLAADDDMLLAGLLLCGTLLLSGPSALSAAFQLHVRNDLAVAAMTANSVAWTAAVLVIALGDGGLVPFAAAFLGAAVLSTALTVVWALRLQRVAFVDVAQTARRMARVGLPLMLAGLLVLAYSRVDQILVYEIAGEREAGLYAIAFRVQEQAHLLPVSVATTLFPLIVAGMASDVPRARRIIQQALDVLALGAFGALAVAIPLGRPLLSWLFGAQYADAGPALAVLMGAFVVMCVGYLAGTLVLPLGLQRRYLAYAAAGLVVNVALNLALLPSQGFMAAAWVTLATEAVVVGLIVRDVIARMGWRPSVDRPARALAAGAATGLLLAALRGADAPIGVLVAVAVVTYPAAALAARAVDVAALRTLVGRG